MTISIVQNELEHWYDHVARFVSSGKTQKEYCLANSLDYSQFKKWRYKFSDDFPVNKEHPRAKKKLEQGPGITTSSDNTSSANQFAKVDIVDDVTSTPASEGSPSKIKLFIKSNIYLELTSDLDSKVLNKVFKALEVLGC